MTGVILSLSAVLSSETVFAQLTTASLTNTNTNSVEKLMTVPTAQDDRRNQKTLDGVLKQAGWFPEVRVSVANGMVTIEGKANDKAQLDWLAKTADRLPAVLAVINKAEVIQSTTSDLAPVLKQTKALGDRAKRAIPSFVIVLVLLSIFYFISKFLNRGIENLWKRRISNPFLLATMSKLTLLPIWVLLFYFTLQVAGLSGLATTIIGGTGIIGIVMGFAFKDIAENYLSGLLMAFRSPFTKGDLIQIGEYQGYVQSLEMRGTTIVDPDGNVILIPNTMVIKSVIQNHTANSKTRLSFTLPIPYTESVSRADRILRESLLEIPEILKDPPPMVIAEEVSGGNVNLKVFFWCNSVKSSSLRLKSVAIAQAKEAFIQNGIGASAPAKKAQEKTPLGVATEAGPGKI